MATHKVPQDVEADDKLVGFLSLKQFIFTVLGLGFGYLTFFFFTNVHPVTALIWLFPTIVFLVLGLYQRKDQPVEVFLASALRFYLKPHKRKWDQEGYEERVKITAPPKIEKHYTKDFSGEEAVSRLTALSRMMDSRGWASKLSTDWQNPQLATAAVSDNRLVQPHETSAYVADTREMSQQITQPVDVMDETSSPVAIDMQARVEQAESAAKQQAVQVLQQARGVEGRPDEPLPTPQVRKYPTMHQKVIRPKQEAPERKVEQPRTPPKQPERPPVQPERHEPVINESDNGVEISLH